MGDVFTYSFRMEEGDFIALSRVLGRRPIWGSIVLLILYFGCVIAFVMAGVNGDLEAGLEIARQIGLGKAPLWIYPLLALGPILVLLRPFYLQFLVGRVYHRNVMADRQLTYRFDTDAIQGGIPEVQGRFLWSVIRRVIVTPSHAFLAISRREALIVPRRAFADDEDFQTLLAFARARIAAASGTFA